MHSAAWSKTNLKSRLQRWLADEQPTCQVSRRDAIIRIVVLDGKETRQLDSVLCLSNTAMLSHEGSFAGNALAGSSSVKKNGSLTNKARKAILKAMDSDDDSSQDDAPRMMPWC
jgi:hypothetical protein